MLELAVGSGATSLGITTGLQFLPFLLLTPFAGLVADRMPKQRLLQLTNLGMALPAAVLGLLAVTGTAEVWHVYVLAFLLGSASAFDAPGPAVVRLRARRPGRPHQRRRPQLRQLQRRPPRRPRPRRPAHRRLRRGIGRDRVGHPAQRGVVRRPDLVAAPPRRQPDRRRGAGRPRARRDPGGRGLRPGAPRPAARAGPGLLRRHLRPQLPDHLRADGHRGLRQGARGVRPARHLPGRRLADRRPARRAAQPGAPPPRRRLRAGLRRRR